MKQAKRKTSVERLVEMIRRDMGIDIPDEWKFYRCRPGHWGRAAGAYSWCLKWNYRSIGSPDSVANCLRHGVKWAGREFVNETLYANI